MATADTINSIRTHLTADYEGLENLGVTAEDRNIENIRTCLDELYNNIPKTTDTGTNLSLNTIKGKMNIIPKGDTQQGKLPSTYQQVEYIEATNGQYIDTGTKLTNNSKVEITSIVTSVTEGSTPIFRF